MNLEEWALELSQSVASNAEASDRFPEDVFTEEALNIIMAVGEAEDFHLCSYKARGMKVNAYNISSDGDCVDLFVTHRMESEPPSRITNSDVEKHFDWLQGFLAKCLQTSLRLKLEESAPEWEAAHDIHHHRDQITRARLYLITDSIARDQSIKDMDLDGVRLTHHLWDIGRLYKTQTSGNAAAAIEINFLEDFGGHLTCLGTTSSDDEYTTFLGFLPAELLVRIYEKYGPRLLERNVRTFLQARGKVNQGIRKTILEEPCRFLAYNNGLSAIADHVSVQQNEGGVCFLTSVKGFQIVNGGQTTASIYTTWKKDKAVVSDIHVQIKLTCPNDVTAIDELAPKISQFANTQNKVNTADFSANDPYHLAMEKLSRSIWAPAPAGSNMLTKWFYERARGAYMDAIGRAPTPAKKREFKIQHPPHQKFTKTDLAKAENTWSQRPQLVCLGAEKNFVEFTDKLREKPVVPDEANFRNLVAKLILFRAAERVVQAQAYGGYRAQIVAYTLAWISHATAQQLDLDPIWQEQSLTEALKEVIAKVSEQAHHHLVHEGGGRNVTEWAKREECWISFRNHVIPIKLPKVKAVAKNGGGSMATRPGIYIAPDDPVLQLGGAGWKSLSSWAKETSNLQIWQRSIAYSIGRLLDAEKNPSEKQLKQAHIILEESRRLGFKA
jgi:hypothetical protein